MPSSHWDLGFTAPPEEVLPKLKPHLDEVITDAMADPEFRWTIESVWQIREWLARTKDTKEVQDFVDLVNKGQIQISAVFGSMHTEFMGAEMLNRLAYDAKSLEKQLGIKTDLAMMDDVPGFTLRLPQVLAGSGVKYFVTGSNLFLFGGTTLSPAHVPFYWEAPDGSRVLTWQTQGRLGGYTEALADYYLDPPAFEPYTKEHFYPKEWEGLPRLEIMQRGVDKLVKKYEDAGYPYDAVMVLYLHDFLPPAQEKDSLLPGNCGNTRGVLPTYRGSLWRPLPCLSRRLEWPLVGGENQFSADQRLGPLVTGSCASRRNALESAHFQRGHQPSCRKFRFGAPQRLEV